MISWLLSWSNRLSVSLTNISAREARMMKMLTMMNSVCAIVSVSSHQSGPSSLIDYSTVCWSSSPHQRSSHCALIHWLTVFLPVSSAMSKSERVSMLWRKVEKRDCSCLCLVYGCPVKSMHLPVCAYCGSTSMARTGLCYCCNEPGICSPFALSTQSTGR